MITTPTNAELLFSVLESYKKCLQQLFKAHAIPLSPLDARVLKLIALQQINTPQALAETSGRDKAQVTRLLNDLDSRGLLQKTPHLHDKRSVCLSVTAEGQAWLERIAELDAVAHHQMFSMLDDRQQQQLGSLLQLVCAGLETA